MKMHGAVAGMVLFFALGAGSALAQGAAPAEAPKADAAQASATPDGKSLFRGKTCIACHGRDGSKAIQNYPELAGQSAKYLVQQMNEIADGKRLSGPDARGYPRTQGMKDIMHLVNAQERQAIAAYLSALPAPKPRTLDPAPDAARLAAGKDAYTKGGCLTCHGPDGLKPTGGYPIIGGMKRDYLALQMIEIRDGVRQNGASKSMVPFSKKLDDAKVGLIADYLSQIERPAK